MVCARVLGNDVAINVGGLQGHLQLNTFKPLMISALLESARLLGDGARSFQIHCVDGLVPDRARIDQHLHRSLMLVTALAPRRAGARPPRHRGRPRAAARSGPALERDRDCAAEPRRQRVEDRPGPVPPRPRCLAGCPPPRRPPPSPLTERWTATFERDDPGTNYYQTGSGYTVEHGALLAHGAHNKPPPRLAAQEAVTQRTHRVRRVVDRAARRHQGRGVRRRPVVRPRWEPLRGDRLRGDLRRLA